MHFSFSSLRLRHVGWALLGLCIGVFSPSFVQAQNNLPNLFPVGAETSIAGWISWVISILNMMTWILFTYLNFLLQPSFIFDIRANGDSNFIDMLNTVWRFSRDVVNIAFAFALVGAALYTVISGKKEFLSEHASKFIMAVILVNFSWFVPRIILDAANVATSAVYGIPSLITNDNGAQKCEYMSNRKEIPDNSPIVPKCEQKGKGWLCPCTMVTDVQWFEPPQNVNEYEPVLGGIVYIKRAILDETKISTHSAILNGLIVNHGRLGQLARVGEAPQAEGTMKFLGFIMREVLVLAIHIALFFPLLAMFVAFIIRIPVLWITIAFMPFVFLGYAAPSAISGYTKKIFDTFIKAAFLPALVAVPLAIGFVLIRAGSQIMNNPLQQIPFAINGVSDMWQLLWLAMSLGVLWMGVFAALKAGQLTEFMGKAVDGIKNYGQTAGKIAMKAPLSARVIPFVGSTPMGLLNKFSPRNLNRIDQSLSQGNPLKNAVTGNDIAGKENKTIAEDQTKVDALGEQIRRLSLRSNDPNASRRNDIIEEIKKKSNISNITYETLPSRLEDIIAEMKNHNTTFDDATQQAIEAIKKSQADAAKAAAARQTPPNPTPQPGGGTTPPTP